MTSNVLRKDKRISIFIQSIICILICACLILKGEPYFYVVALYGLISNYDEKLYLLANASSIICGYLISINNGNMVVIISAIFFLFKIISIYLIKENNVKRMFSYIATSLIIFTIYFVRDISYASFSTLLFAFSLSFLCFYAFHKVLDNYQYSKNNVDSKDRIIIYTIFPFLYEGLNVFHLLFIRVIHLILIKSAKFSEALSALILMSFFFAYFLNMSQTSILLFVLPFLFSFMVSKDHPIFTYLIFYILSNVFLVEKFYVEPEFYQGLIAIFFVLLIPESFFYNLSSLLKKEEKNEEITKNENIENVLSYLSVVLDSKLEDIKNPLDSTFEELKKDLCLSCKKKDTCNLFLFIKEGIKDSYTKEQRKRILDDCEAPYKLFKRTISFHEIFLKEEKKHKDNLYLQELYKKEVENLYYPLKDNNKEIALEDLCEELKKENLPVVDIKKSKDSVFVELSKYRFDDEETIITILNDVLNTSFVFIDKKYSFSLGNYILEFSNKIQYITRIGQYTKSYITNNCGDKLFYEENQNEFKLLLSDGMGHNQKAAALSEYLIDVINTYSKIDKGLSRQIETANRLIYQKSNLEMYATLDYFILDLVTLKFTLFKAGSFPTYIYHDGKIKESKKNFIPLGILEKIEPFAYRDFLSEGDIVIFLTDGFGNDVKEKIEEVLSLTYDENIQTITSALKEKLLEQDDVEDDKTIVAIKIEKKD